MFKACFSALLLVIVTACGPRYGDFFPCHDDGTIKPRVVLLPMRNLTGQCEVGDNLMQTLRYCLMDRGDLYIYPDEVVNRQLNKMGPTSFFTPDVSFARQFGGTDYIVATELVECHSDLFGNVDKSCMPPHLQRKNLLILKLRVRVIDLRCNEPVIILQEMMSRNLLVPNRKVDDCEVDTNCFLEVSSRLATDLVNRLNEVLGFNP